MENEKILESLDSNWFYSSVFKPPSFPSCNLEDPHELKQPEPNIQIHQPQPILSLSSQLQPQPISDASTQVLQEEPCGMEQTGTGKRISKAGSKRRRRSVCIQECEEIKGSMELGFVPIEAGTDGRMFSDVLRLGRTRYWVETSRNPTFHCKMPPYGEGMVMKEHLRSWAHAVACTVR
eukprot:TRINITY_DN6122_c0_g1_i1.p1 TRINITY_DN6122_c0_g1~~TRINITY_DN6122_c0_g1_i1.p1  ORF type:complete len:178 (+),score=33.68 TRINITY_DN6122_c0_g1_i1:76-609(+)